MYRYAILPFGLAILLLPQVKLAALVFRLLVAELEVVMVHLSLERRSILAGAATLGISHVLLPTGAAAQSGPQGFVLGANGGEHLVHFRNPGNIFIKAGAATGSPSLAFGTQQVPVAAGIPVHRHFQMDEAFYVLEGSGAVSLNDVRQPLEKGGTIFIPKNTWHGFSNPDQELLLLWLVTPAGLDGFFRETCNPPGVPPKPLTRAQVNEIARKYATEFR
jgi:quercetin dioxygenase-like cupin family protein